jgi:hypothetical protein
MRSGQVITPFMSMEQHVIDGKVVYVDYPIDMEKVMRGIIICE